mgnify:CR=1 FL=1
MKSLFTFYRSRNSIPLYVLYLKTILSNAVFVSFPLKNKLDKHPFGTFHHSYALEIKGRCAHGFYSTHQSYKNIHMMNEDPESFWIELFSTYFKSFNHFCTLFSMVKYKRISLKWNEYLLHAYKCHWMDFHSFNRIYGVHISTR